jgi:hypothetical protein
VCKERTKRRQEKSKEKNWEHFCKDLKHFEQGTATDIDKEIMI